MLKYIQFRSDGVEFTVKYVIKIKITVDLYECWICT